MVMVTSHMRSCQPRRPWCLTGSSAPHWRRLASGGMPRYSPPGSRGRCKACHRVPSVEGWSRLMERAEATERRAASASRTRRTRFCSPSRACPRQTPIPASPHTLTTMLGVEGYGSDSENDDEPQATQSQSKHSIASSLPPPTKRSSLALPSPVSGVPGASSTSKPAGGLSLPPPKAKKSKKIAIGLPELPREPDRADDDEPPAKKPRIEPGARSSGLLSMLPAPKNKAPVAPTPERVLGAGRGPGLVFNTGSARSAKTATVEDVPEGEDEDGLDGREETSASPRTAPSLPFLPPSLAKGKANISVEERADKPKVIRSAPAVDFFSLGTYCSR